MIAAELINRRPHRLVIDGGAELVRQIVGNSSRALLAIALLPNRACKSI
jgi:hypothetical protein